MSLESLRSQKSDPGRGRRVAVAYVAAAVAVSGLLGAGVVFGGQIRKQIQEEAVEVKFVPKETKKPEPPPPPPPPPPVVRKVEPVSNEPAAKGTSETPDKIPEKLGKEVDPNHAAKAVSHVDGRGNPNGVIGGRGTGEVFAPAPEPTAAEGPPRVVVEDVTDAKPLDNPMPAYPLDARKEHVETVVVLRIQIDERGLVTDVRLVEGHPLFNSIVIETVRKWRYSPARLGGVAIARKKQVRIPFRLRTQ